MPRRYASRASVATGCLVNRERHARPAQRPLREPCLSGALCLLLLVACEPVPEGPDSTGLVLRFVEDDPQEVTAPTTFFEWTPTREWSFRADDGTAPWIVPDGTGWNGFILDLVTDLAAEEIDGVDLLVKSLRPNVKMGATFLWATPESGFSSAHSAALTCEARGELYLCRAALRGRQGWVGKILRLRFMSSIAPQDLEIRSAHLLAKSGSAAALERATREGVKVRLGRDFRNALLGFPGAPVERRFHVPPGSRLRFSYGRLTRAGPVAFRVSTEGGEILFQETVASDSESEWLDAEVDLGSYAGRELLLRLEIDAPWATDPLDALAFWGHPEIVAPPTDARPSIVLISVDTLRADHLSLYGYHRPTSPHLDTWARESAAVFRSAVAQAPWTLPSHVSMLTGLDPFRHGCNHDRAGSVRSSLETLPEIVRQAGYATLAVTGGAYLHPDFGFAQGFDRFFPSDYLKSLEDGNTTLENAVTKAARWMKEQGDRRFFLFFHTYETHAPYRSRQPYFSRFTGMPTTASLKVEISQASREEGFVGRMPAFSDVRSDHDLTSIDTAEVVAAAYDSGIAFVDEQLGRLFAGLRASKLDDDTIVVVTSDHGEMLGEHGVGGHMYLYDENLLVPLIVASPDGRGAGSVIPDQVRSIDIPPTILDLAGIAGTDEGIDGVSLVPLLEGRAGKVPEQAISYNAFWNSGISLRLDNRLKYVFNDTAWSPVAGEETLFSLPAESRDVAPESADTAALRQLVRDAFRAGAPGLRIRFESGPGGGFTGSVKGGGIEVHRVKSVDLKCPCLQFAAPGMTFRVPPQTSYTIAVLSADDMLLDLSLSAAGPEGPLEFAHQLDTSEIAEDLTIGLTDSGWRVIASSRRPASYVTLSWQGDRQPAATEDTGPSEETLEQLRALGYVP